MNRSQGLLVLLYRHPVQYRDVSAVKFSREQVHNRRTWLLWHTFTIWIKWRLLTYLETHLSFIISSKHILYSLNSSVSFKNHVKWKPLNVPVCRSEGAWVRVELQCPSGSGGFCNFFFLTWSHSFFSLFPLAHMRTVNIGWKYDTYDHK